MDFRVDLEIFRGPLDLLLYLVRKHEVDIVGIPIALVADQYVQYMEVLEQIDVNSASDFLEMASTLTEIKSRMVLPRGDEVDEELEDPRQELVRQLLEYKKFKDAASVLDERSRQWQERFPRLGSDRPPHKRNLAEEPIHEVELWDLVSAFGRILRDRRASQPSNIVYDDTPIHVYMARIRTQLVAKGRLTFSDLFQSGMHKSTLVGIFLAILELVRHDIVHADQNQNFGEIWILPGARIDNSLDPTVIDSYEPSADSSTDDAPKPR